MAKSKFDLSLLKPVDDQNSDFEKNLKPLDDEDAGSYLDNLPEPEGFWHKLPRNVLTGLTHAGRNLHNLPHDVVHLGDVVGSGIGRFLGAPELQKKDSGLASYLPYDEQDYSDVWGGNKENDTMMDKLIKGGIEHAPEIIGGAGLVRGGFRRLTGAHQLDLVKKAVEQKGLQDFAYPKQMIKDAEKFLPSTKSTKELLGEVKAGKYGPAFDLQSQVGHHQRKLLKSPLASENSIMAPKAGELKQSMLGHLEQVLRNANHIEEADLLRKGVNNYRQYIKVKKAVMPLIKYLGIPTTILGALSVGYNKSKQVLGD